MGVFDQGVPGAEAVGFAADCTMSVSRGFRGIEYYWRRRQVGKGTQHTRRMQQYQVQILQTLRLLQALLHAALCTIVADVARRYFGGKEELLARDAAIK